MANTATTCAHALKYIPLGFALHSGNFLSQHLLVQSLSLARAISCRTGRLYWLHYVGQVRASRAISNYALPVRMLKTIPTLAAPVESQNLSATLTRTFNTRLCPAPCHHLLAVSYRMVPFYIHFVTTMSAIPSAFRLLSAETYQHPAVPSASRSCSASALVRSAPWIFASTSVRRASSACSKRSTYLTCNFEPVLCGLRAWQRC